MAKPSKNLKLLCISCFVLGLAFGCVEIEPYESCGFPPAQEEQCLIKSGGQDCKDTGDCPSDLVCEPTSEQGVKACIDPAYKAKASAICQVEQAQCPDGYCVSYHGSSGFCSEECDPALDDCPAGGTCVKSANGCLSDGTGCMYFCIKNSLTQ